MDRIDDVCIIGLRIMRSVLLISCFVLLIAAVNNSCSFFSQSENEVQLSPLDSIEQSINFSSPKEAVDQLYGRIQDHGQNDSLDAHLAFAYLKWMNVTATNADALPDSGQSELFKWCVGHLQRVDTNHNYPQVVKLSVDFNARLRSIERMLSYRTSIQSKAEAYLKSEALKEDDCKDFQCKVIHLYKSAYYDKALEAIDSALSIDSNASNARFWYIRGYILKDQFKYYSALSTGKLAREAAVKSYKRAIELTDTNEYMRNDAVKSLKFLAATIYNEAAMALDASAIEFGMELFESYFKIVQEFNIVNDSAELWQRRVDINLFAASKLSEYQSQLIEHDTIVAAQIDSLYNIVLAKEPKNVTANYNGYLNSVADREYRSKLLRITSAQNQKNEAIASAKNTQLWAMTVGLLLTLILAGVAFKAYKQKRKDNELIAFQKQEVEKAHEELTEKNKEITDSIHYAKRIQTAILPPDRLVKEYLPNNFILYKPKDVVAGDFYWMYTKPEENLVLFAAADCTGHGVPGAMVSVVCNSALNRAVKEFGLREPGDILTKTRELVVEEFEKSDEEVKDGMDIALCSLSTLSKMDEPKSEKYSLKYAGAYNPLWIIRKNATEVEEIKAHKQAIGLVENSSEFPTHTIELNKGDAFYIFSDGFVDQFGGEKGKKFKAPNFRRLLLSIQDQPLDEQKLLIDKTFDEWKGSLEQIDDVCVIGVRV